MPLFTQEEIERIQERMSNMNCNDNKNVIQNRKGRRRYNMDSFKGMVITILVVVVIALVVVDVISPTYGFFARVDSGNVGIVTHFGKVEDRVLQAGFHFTSWFEHVHPISVRTQIKSGEVLAFSSDIQQVTLYVSVNYNVTPDAANTLYKTVGNDYFGTLVSPRVNEDVKAVVSKYTAESLIANREKLSGEILALLKNDIVQYGITVSTISVENIDFTDAFESAVEAKQVATQEAQRAKTLQEQQTMEAKQDAERKKIEASAAADVIRQNADAAAYETKVKAEAQAEANRLISETITENLIDYVEAQNWDGKLPTFVGSDGVMPIINMETKVGDEQ